VSGVVCDLSGFFCESVDSVEHIWVTGHLVEKAARGQSTYG